MGDDLYETLKATAIGHIRAFEDPNPFDTDEVYAFRSDDFHMIFHPTNSLPPPFNDGAVITRQEHEPALRALNGVITAVKFHIKQITVDVKERVVTVRHEGHYDYRAIADMKEEKDWMVEYVWMTKHDESGKKIVSMHEVIDVVQVLPMLQRAGKYMELNEQKG